MSEIAIKSETQLDVAGMYKAYLKNKSLADRAINVINEKLLELPTDLTSLGVIEGDKIESDVNDLRTRGADAIKLNKERRMVFTRRMNEIKSAFIQEEKRIEEPLQQLINYANAWNKEKYNRQEAERKEQERKMAIENAKIDYEQRLKNMMISQTSSISAGLIDRMNSKFYGLDAEGLLEYDEQLRTYMPKELILSDFIIGEDRPEILTAEVAQIIRKKTIESTIAEMNAKHQTQMAAEVGRILDLIPGRISELERIADDAEAAKEAAERIKKEEAERKAQLDREKEEAERKAKEDAEAAKMDVAFENAAVGVATELSKGTQVKLKYDVQNHAQMLKIIQWWVTNALPLMTVEDMLKKLSFMRTSASNALNKGEKIEGVPTVEDIRTRSTRSKK